MYRVIERCNGCGSVIRELRLSDSNVDVAINDVPKRTKLTRGQVVGITLWTICKECHEEQVRAYNMA